MSLGGGANVVLEDTDPLLDQPMTGSYYPLPTDPPQSTAIIAGRATISSGSKGPLSIINAASVICLSTVL